MPGVPEPFSAIWLEGEVVLMQRKFSPDKTSTTKRHKFNISRLLYICTVSIS
jgi:hypothetical protein